MSLVEDQQLPKFSLLDLLHQHFMIQIMHLVPRGGIPVSIGSSEGFGYQPLISAGGTAVVGSTGHYSINQYRI